MAHPWAGDYHFSGESARAGCERVPDGRFIVDLSLDAFTRKSLPLSRAWLRQQMISEDRNWWAPLATAHISGLGQVATSLKHRAETRLLPPPNRLNIPADQLELWLQVALRGEIGPDGRFLKWEESKWEKKRQELAAIKPPFVDIPFPGYLATDKLHWLRVEQETEGAQTEQIELELLRRAEFFDDQNEAARWRTLIQSRDGIKGPPPRELK